MKKTYASIFSFAFIALIVFWIFFSMTPHFDFSVNVPLSEFSTNRALEHVKEISKKPHYVGSKNHTVVANYLETELKNLGLEVKTEDAFTMVDGGVLVKSHNIMARIKGNKNSKCLLLLSHYDSAPHSKSKGASDDGAGIGAIIESVRAFVHNNTAHKNDIIILFSDAEEVGLNGAAAFVTKNKWAKEVGLVINFEARGTSGPSYMLMEVNSGNAALVKHFQAAKTEFPVGNSLMYSIYKMLPNDTDLTIFREQGKIQGFNFAFIDNHFNYHTAQDDVAHLNKNSLAQQGTYLMPLLKYFVDADLKILNSADDFVYFNTPVNFVSYPFSWTLPLSIAALAALIILVFIGLGKRLLSGYEIIRGLILFLLSLVASGLSGFLLWKLILLVYPQYKDILHGFTYNGHYYIYAFLALTLALNFYIYNKKTQSKAHYNFGIAPLFVLIVINIVISIYLPGAGFFIIPAWCCMFILAYFIITQKSNLLFQLILIVPVLIIFVPFLTTFPIGLGLKMLFVSSILLSIIFTLLTPIFASFEHKKYISLFFFAVAIGFLIQAHVNSDYEFGKAKPNSLLYVQDSDTGKANWVTYDLNLDIWTNNFFKDSKNNTSQIPVFPLSSKYNSGFSFAASTTNKKIAAPTIQFLKDSVSRGQRFLKILIAPTRNVNRYDVFAPENLEIFNFKANNVKPIESKGATFQRSNSRVVRYYVTNNEPLLMEFSTKSNTNLNMELLESSFDLLENPAFKIPKRENWMMPLPFVLTDAVVIKQKIRPTTIVKKDAVLPVKIWKKKYVQKTKVQIDTLL